MPGVELERIKIAATLHIEHRAFAQIEGVCGEVHRLGRRRRQLDPVAGSIQVSPFRYGHTGMNFPSANTDVRLPDSSVDGIRALPYRRRSDQVDRAQR